MRFLQNMLTALARLLGFRTADAEAVPPGVARDQTEDQPAGQTEDQTEDQTGDPSIAGQVVNGAFRDRNRNRVVPFKLYTPDKVTGPAPVVLFSHGLGGSREAAPYLGEELARHGYFAFFLQHPGSDETILEGAETTEEIQERMLEAMQKPENGLSRFLDTPFVLDQIAEMNQKTRLKGRLDLNRIGMIGHSFGARGTLAAAGQRIGQHGARFKDARIRAGVPLSPNLPSAPGQSLEGVYDAIDIPLLHITGTQDGMGFGEGDFDPQTRTLPFRYIPFPEQYLLVLDGATHTTFSGRVDDGDTDMHDAIALAVVLFFDACLKGDAEAKRILREDFADTLAAGDIFEIK